ncbi:MAG: RtcB family protein [Chlorobiales bacterium]|nr:RtcB family protein [Chlorobiales bacterium]
MATYSLTKSNLRRIRSWLWEIPADTVKGMLVPGRFYASEAMLDQIFADRSLQQLVHVAMLPGIRKYALAMPDIHEGYGFPIGGVAAFDLEEGVISPGGIGYDINCGVRLLKSDKLYTDIRETIPSLAKEMYRSIPSGVGHGNRITFSEKELDVLLENGAPGMAGLGYGDEDDLLNQESGGRAVEADPAAVSRKAKARGMDQLGTLGAGNHFIEIDTVDTVYDLEAAESLGLTEGMVVVQVHTGSRGLGHQTASDYLKIMGIAMSRYGIRVPDRELACVPFRSKEGQDYFQAMSAVANFAWANRQLITWEVRKSWRKIIPSVNLGVVYDVCHNIARIEQHLDDEKQRTMLVHRKGATRAFPRQPVIIPGSMGTGSFVLQGSERALAESFGSCCHGAGRCMSRTKAKKTIHGEQLKKTLETEGIYVQAGSVKGLAEEAPQAYKDVHDVVDTVAATGIATKVAFLKPVAVIKG